MLRGRRQELHARVAAALEEHFADLVERQPELLAHHLTAAGNTERAVDQWLKAGQYAAERSAHLEAIRHFDRGLAALGAQPEGPARDGREIELQLARGLSLFTTEGFAARGATEIYTRASELAEQRGDPRQQFMAVYGLWQSANGGGRTRECRKFSDRLLQLTEGTGDDGLYLQAHHSAWSTCLYAGEPAAARSHSEIGRQLYDPEQHRSHRLLYGGHDPGACARYIGAQAQWLLGYPEEALALEGEAVALAERLAHPFSLELALLWNALLRLERREPELALQRLDAAETLAAEQRLGFLYEPRFARGAALSAQGALEEAVACLREGLASRLGALTFRPFGLASLAEALTQQGDYDAALEATRGGQRLQEEYDQRRWEAELHRLEGIALFGLNRLEEAKTPSKRRCASREDNRRSPTSCAPRRASPGCGANRAGGPRRAICWHPSTAGSPRASTPPT